MEPAAAFTAVFVIWGEKFGAAHVNALVRDIAAKTRASVTYICLSDRDRPGLDDRVTLKPIPEPFPRPPVNTGTRAKLSQFLPGLLPADRPAVFFDLDTMVLGDAASLAARALSHGGLTMLPATFEPVWWLHRGIARVTGGRMRGRINGSVYAYLPPEMADLPKRFLEDFKAAGDAPPRWMTGHDRWLSVRAEPRLSLWPGDKVAKFGDVFANPLSRSTRRMMDRLVALTFPGEDLGPEALLAAPEGARLTDIRGRRMTWSDAATDGWASRIVAHWQAVEDEHNRLAQGEGTGAGTPS